MDSSNNDKIPTTYSECLNPGRFLTAGEIGEAMWTVRVAQLYREELADEDGGAKTRTTMAIANSKGEIHDRRIVLNRTNIECLRAMWGDRVADWVGKRVFLYSIPNAFRGLPGIRIWGSPDLEAELQIEVRLPKKKPQKFVMRREKRGA